MAEDNLSLLQVKDYSTGEFRVVAEGETSDITKQSTDALTGLNGLGFIKPEAVAYTYDLEPEKLIFNYTGFGSFFGLEPGAFNSKLVMNGDAVSDDGVMATDFNIEEVALSVVANAPGGGAVEFVASADMKPIEIPIETDQSTANQSSLGLTSSFLQAIDDIFDQDVFERIAKRRRRNKGKRGGRGGRGGRGRGGRRPEAVDPIRTEPVTTQPQSPQPAPQPEPPTTPEKNVSNTGDTVVKQPSKTLTPSLTGLTDFIVNGDSNRISSFLNGLTINFIDIDNSPGASVMKAAASGALTAAGLAGSFRDSKEEVLGAMSADFPSEWWLA